MVVVALTCGLHGQRVAATITSRPAAPRPVASAGRRAYLPSAKPHWMTNCLPFDRALLAHAEAERRRDATTIDTAAPRDYFTDLQDRIVARLEAIERASFRRDAWTRARRRRRRFAADRAGQRARARRRAVLARHGRPVAGFGDRAPPRARRPRLGSDGRVAGAPSAQSLCADRASQRAVSSSRRRRAPSRSGGSAAAWT